MYGRHMVHALSCYVFFPLHVYRLAVYMGAACKPQRCTTSVRRVGMKTLLTFSLLIREDLWFFLDFLSDRSVFSDFAAESKNTAMAEKIKGKPEILTN